MNKLIVRIVTLLLSIVSINAYANDDIVGFWKTIDEVTNTPQSVVAVYKYQDKYYGRLILSYNENGTVQDTIYAPSKRAPGVVGEPYYSGMDIIYNLKKNGNKYTDGNIIDPEKGNRYGAELWVQDGVLYVRGKLLFFGRNQKWPPAQHSDFPQGFVKPDLTKMVPVIPKLK
jgi:uncharacterized protein (DUF2147 family)